MIGSLPIMAAGAVLQALSLAPCQSWLQGCFISLILGSLPIMAAGAVLRALSLPGEAE